MLIPMGESLFRSSLYSTAKASLRFTFAKIAYFREPTIRYRNMVTLQIVLIVLGAYLLGSIPTAVWLGKFLHGVDVREHGSHNAGATNTIRVLGVKSGVAVLLIDILKGFAAVSLGAIVQGHFGQADHYSTYCILLGICAVLGHIFPVFAHFRGGKGVATMAGVVLALQPWAFLCALGIFAVVLLLTRYVSLGSTTAGVSYPFILYFVFHEHSTPYVVFSICVALLLLSTHRRNIKRLLNGTESKFKPTSKGSLGGKR